MKINATDITNVYYDGNADALYKGDNKIWPLQEHYTEIVVDLSLRENYPDNVYYILMSNNSLASDFDADYKKVDWGDGTVTYGYNSHKYKDSGIYTIRFGCDYAPGRSNGFTPCAIKLNRLNDIGYFNLESFFEGCTNLT